MNPVYDFDDIEDYLANRMTAPDRTAFEQALQTDADLVQRVNALRAEEKVLQLLEEEHWLGRFAEWDKASESQKKTTPPPPDLAGSTLSKIRLRQWWPVIPVALLALVVWKNIPEKPSNNNNSPTSVPAPEDKDTPTPQDTAAQQRPIAAHATEAAPADKPGTVLQPVAPKNRDPYADLAKIAFREANFDGTTSGGGREETSADVYTEARRFYRAKKYDKALSLLENIDKTQLQKYLYLRAYTCYHLQQYARAEQDFYAFRKFTTSNRKIDAVWGEVFCLVKQLPASRKRLEEVLAEITSDPIYAKSYRKDAIRLQQKLRQK